MFDLDKVLEKADDLFLHENKVQESLDLLLTLDHSEVKVLYRLARACFQLAKHTQKRPRKLEILNQGFKYVQDALARDETNCQAHCWYAVILDALAEMRGIRERAIRLQEIEYHMLRAKELDPDDSVPCFIYGMLNYGLAELPWYQRKILEAIFPKIPTGSFEVALENFMQAEKNQTDFYSVNKLMTAKCHIALRNFEEAKIYLNRALSVRTKNEDDAACKLEAQKLLDKINQIS